MRRIELKTITVAEPIEGMPSVIDYREQFITVLRLPLQGMTIDQMELPLRILPKLRASNGTVALEEEEHKYLLDRLNAMQFRVVMPELVEMRNAVKDARSVEI